MSNPLPNFVVLDSYYGQFIVGRHCHFQAEALVKTGKTHIEQELQVIAALVNTISTDGIIVDAGANIGFFTIPIAQFVKQKNIKIISFEPQRQLYYSLCGSIALNELENCFIHNLGLGDVETTANLSDVDYTKPADYGMVSVSKGETQEHPFMRKKSLKVVTLDSLKLPRLDFLKLDVEGFECNALRGAHNTIIKNRPWIWVEYNMIGADAIKNELKHLQDYGFVIVDWQNMICAPIDKLQQVGITQWSVANE